MASDHTCRTNDLRHEIDRLVERAVRPRHGHSLVLAVRSDDGQIDIGSAAGGAEPGDSYFVASIAKMFTATMVIQLIDEGRLDLDARLQDHLPGVDLDGIHTHKGEDYSDRITIRHLLQHSSGLPDYFAGDQIRFLQAFHGGALFDPTNLARMQQWNRIFFPLEYGYGLMRYRLPRFLTPFGALPELIGHSGVTGSFAFSAPEHGLHIAGAFNQLDKPSRPYGFMSKVAKTATDHLRR